MSDFVQLGGMFASALAGALVGFWISRATTRDQFFYTAAAKLKVAFNETLIMLNLPEDKFVDLHAVECMDNSFWKHERAVIEFRYALPKFQRRRFDNAWENYKGNDTGPEKMTKKYFAKQNWQHIALCDIEAILYFTEHNPSSFDQRIKNIYGKIKQKNNNNTANG